MFEENEISVNSQGGTELIKRGLAAYLPQELTEQFQIICSRVRELNKEKIRVYWVHDLSDDPEISHLKDAASFDRFHKLIFVSNWQQQQLQSRLGIPLNQNTIVIDNHIEPIVDHRKSTDEIRLVYFSTPQRGLDILVPVFEELCKRTVLNVHLDVYSSFDIYGWPNSNERFEPLFQKCRDHPRIHYHGNVSNDEIRQALTRSHILAYPSTWQETSCRVLMESMSAGLLCVHSNLGALAETSGGLTQMYQFCDNVNEHAGLFLNNLEHTINIVHDERVQNFLKFAKAYADSRFNIAKIGSSWEGVLKGLLANYPTVESRSTPKEYFVYKTG